MSCYVSCTVTRTVTRSVTCRVTCRVLLHVGQPCFLQTMPNCPNMAFTKFMCATGLVRLFINFIEIRRKFAQLLPINVRPVLWVNAVN